jgi:hypothetical protein
MRDSITLINGDGVRNAITRVKDDSGGATRGVKSEDSLN